MKIVIHYPCTDGEIVLRTEADWMTDLRPVSVSADRTVHEFAVETERPFFYFKPMLVQGGRALWARGKNYLALRHVPGDRELWPHFQPDDTCSVCDLRQLADPATGISYRYRVFHPPGYTENRLKHYPVLYLQDGQRVFFHDGHGEVEADHDWRIDETLTLLADMNAVDKVLAVGVYPNVRERDYAFPGCEGYARFLAETLKPHIDREFRTLPQARHTAIMGSSLGGVASFYAGWEWPGSFGNVACLSTSFGWRDDLADRLAREAKRDVRIYLDSGWPQDNYEVTRDMWALLGSRGWVQGRDLFYFAFPTAQHDERSWAVRCHVPIQLFFGLRPGPEPAMAAPPDRGGGVRRKRGRGEGSGKRSP